MRFLFIGLVAAVLSGCSSGPNCPGNRISHSTYWEETRKCAKGCRYYTEHDRTVFCKDGTHYFDWLVHAKYGSDDSYLVTHPLGIHEKPKAIILEEMQ